jgi:release factor glutamine methyltransferase
LAAQTGAPALDAQVLLAHVLEQPRAWLLAHPETELTPAQAAAFETCLVRLERGEPLPYLLGHWEFYGLEFIINPSVLIPRPETELLVETALAWLRAHPDRRQAVDVGAGSGCIAVSLAKLVPDLQVTAVDISSAALDVIRLNASRHGVAERIHCQQSDLLTGAHGPFDLICANLPYIPTGTLADLPVAAYEPRQALDGGPDGLQVIRRLLDQSCLYLSPGGLLLVEIENRQGKAVMDLAGRCSPTWPAMTGCCVWSAAPD